MQSRTAAAERQRSSSAGSFLLSTITGSGRGSDLTTGRTGSPKPVTLAPTVEISSVVNRAAEPTPPAPASGIGMQKLLDALSSLGMSTAGLNISYGEESVGYPGGSYMNRQISVTSGGKTEQFSADLTERNAMVTAYEMQRYLGIVPNPANAKTSHG